jgi:ATP-dependent Clp protease ATP-binding subunit ClpA
MPITLPIYLEERQAEGRLAHIARAVFFPELQERHELASRAVSKLAKKLQKELNELAQKGRHEELAAYSFYPDDVHESAVKLMLNLGDRHVEARYLLFTFAALGRRVAFTPTLPDVWFEVARGETLKLRAQEVYEQHFRAFERREGKGASNPQEFGVGGKAWLSALDVPVSAPDLFVKPEKEQMALLGGGEVGNGAAELYAVGRCLDWLYPDELDKPVGRMREADELHRLLHARDRRPVVLLGPRGAGKTALLHEAVRRAIAARRAAHSGTGQFWLLAPQRLVAGMSYVGQWEARLLAIVKEARRQRHLLYFDDLLGLFQAGISAQSSLSMAHVLRPYVERRDVRVVAEITPEAWRVLQEKDRGFADLFHVLRVNEMGEDATLRALISVARELELRYECRFQTDALPAVLDLQRRYVREAVFPGKAAAFLQRVARKHAKGWVTRGTALEEFRAQSGLNLDFLDDRKTRTRADILKELQARVVGQDAALTACADVLALAKARLNDATRPLASMLFLGPTGVGKTYCAKTLAAYLFGDAERLLRFDMNEFASPYAVARLVGTFDQPEGLLTGALRRQPFAVVLLDEIEKAHADVFNLLLQVMGDARLTDALGRTADFSNAIIILTSNLGVREAGVKVGLRQTNTREGHVFVKAAEKFFKPEFFNRLDRIVPFERLRREDVGDIARHLMDEVLNREGLARRRCKLLVDDATLNAVVEAGYHPQLGARALKRAVERQITQPIAARVAGMAVDAALAISLSSDAKGKLRVAALELRPAPQSLTRARVSDPDDFLDATDDFLNRIEDRIETHRPAGAAAYDSSNAAAARYFVVREHIQRLERMMRRAEQWLKKPTRAKNEPRPAPPNERQLFQFVVPPAGGPARPDKPPAGDTLSHFNALMAAGSGGWRLLNEWAEAGAAFGVELADYLQDVAREAALLEALAGAEEAAAIVALQPLDATDQALANALATQYARILEAEIGVTVSRQHPLDFATLKPRPRILFALRGAHALALMRGEQGLHARWEARESLGLVNVSVHPLEPDADLNAALDNFASPPSEWPSVVRLYALKGGAFDCRTGFIAAGRALHDGALRTFMLAGLEMPEELVI